MSVRVSEPTLCPADVGVKVTPMVQFDAGVVAWRATVQLLLCTAKLPLATTVVMVKAAVPVFETVRIIGALATPTFWGVAKSRLDDERVTMGAEPAVPLKSTTCVSCAPPVSVSVNVILAVRAGGVIDVGVKVTLIAQVPRAGIDPVQVFV